MVSPYSIISNLTLEKYLNFIISKTEKVIASHGMIVNRHWVNVWRHFEHAWVTALVILEYGSYCVAIHASVISVLLSMLPPSWGDINETDSMTGNEYHDCMVNQDQA